MRWVLGLIAVLVLGGTARAQGNSGEEAAIMKVVTGVFEGLRKGDSSIVRPLFHAKARLITVDSRSPNARIEESAEGFIAFIGGAQPGAFDEPISNVLVHVDGSMASVWADYQFFRGTTRTHCGVDHFLLVKEGGSWKIIELADTRRRENCG